MKRILYLLFCLIVFSGFQKSVAQLSATSVANGNWMSPSTWDCNCVPFPGYDVTIDHNVTLDTGYAHISGTFTINTSGSLVQDGSPRDFALTGGLFSNHGVFTINDFSITGGSLDHYGTITVADLYV